MSLNRVQIMDALYDLAVSSGDFVTKSQRLRLWTDVPAQPALFLRWLGDEYGDRPGRMPAVAVTMHFEIWIYYKASDLTEAPGRKIAELVTGLEDALRPLPSMDYQNLGLSYVSSCYIQKDKIDIDDGATQSTGQAVARVPIRIVAIS